MIIEHAAPAMPAERPSGVWDYVSPSRLARWLKCPLAFKHRYELPDRLDGVLHAGRLLGRLAVLDVVGLGELPVEAQNLLDSEVGCGQRPLEAIDRDGTFLLGDAPFGDLALVERVALVAALRAEVVCDPVEVDDGLAGVLMEAIRRDLTCAWHDAASPSFTRTIRVNAESRGRIARGRQVR